MKINREARLNARQIFRACLVNGNLDEARLQTAVGELADKQPRNYLPILSQIQHLLEIWTREHTHAVEAATDLPDQGRALFAQLEQQFGRPLATAYTINPGLLGGLRVRVGSNLWDGTVSNRLNLLKQALN